MTATVGEMVMAMVGGVVAETKDHRQPHHLQQFLVVVSKMVSLPLQELSVNDLLRLVLILQRLHLDHLHPLPCRYLKIVPIPFHLLQRTSLL
jgi:hypothetical protein